MHAKPDIRQPPQYQALVDLFKDWREFEEEQCLVRRALALPLSLMEQPELRTLIVRGL